MSTHRIKIIAALSAIACCTGLTATLANEGRSQTRAGAGTSAASVATPAQAQDADEKVSVASSDAAQTAAELKGRKVMGTDGQELGSINDFILDAQTGKIVYAVVSSGGAFGIGDTLRLVQQSSLQAASGGDAFMAQLDKAAFDAIPEVDQQALDADRFAPVSSQSQRISDATEQQAESGTFPQPALGSTAAGATTPEPTPSPSSSGTVASATTEPVEVTAAPSGDAPASAPEQSATHLMRASELAGKSVRSGEQEVGRIEAVALDLQQGTAKAVLEAKGEFAGTEGTFHVPLEKLQFDASNTDSVSTTLAQSDFAQAQSSPQQSGTTGGFAATTEENLTPTGRTPRGPTATDTELATAQTDANATDTTRAQSGAGIGSSSPAPTPDTRIHSPELSPTSPVASNEGTAPATSESTASTTPPNPDDEQLTPTGRESAGPHQAVSAASSAIRAALQNDTAVAGENIDVKEAGQKIMLQGTVRSEETKDQIEKIAETAAKGVNIDNKIKVEDEE